MNEIHFGKLKIGNNNPVIIIAEIADSHNGSMETAKQLVDEAKKAGADVAKFQLHLPDEEMVPESITMWDGPLYDILKKNLFTPEMHKEIKEYCEQVGIEYLCTPFCPKAIDILEEMDVCAFKTGSGELTHLPMHRKLAHIASRRKLPVIVSTGMSTWDEIAQTVSVYESENAKEFLVLTNCTSEYPPSDYSHANIGNIPEMKKRFKVLVGQSDHTMDNYTAFAAVSVGANVIEKHFTLSRNQKGPDHFIALEPANFRELAGGIRKIEKSLAVGRNVSKEEQVVRDWAFHSVVANQDIKKGEKLSLENLIPKRPGSGISVQYLDSMYSDELLGKRAKKDLPKNTILQWEDVE
jgi:sialic acid synthase SpsE